MVEHESRGVSHRPRSGLRARVTAGAQHDQTRGPFQSRRTDFSARLACPNDSWRAEQNKFTKGSRGGCHHRARVFAAGRLYSRDLARWQWPRTRNAAA
jgi:hypothetical protein